jgi:hypothetical protein
MDTGEQIEHLSKKEHMLEALTKSLGVVTPALKKANVARSTFYKWKKEDTDFANAVADIDEICLDHSESRLHKLINEGSPAAIFFHLKTKGKKRGYIERQEFDNNITIPDLVQVYLPQNGRDPIKVVEEDQRSLTDG